MTDTNIPLTSDTDYDDLPRTLRRERDRLTANSAAQSAPSSFGVDTSEYDTHYDRDAMPASVERINMSFFSLMMFLLKAVVAAIPALILLTVILWFAGQALQIFFPELIQMKILISFPGETTG